MEIVCNNLMKAINDMKAFLAIATANLTDDSGKTYSLSVTQMPANDDGFGCEIEYQKKHSTCIPIFNELRFRYDRSLKSSPYYSDEFTRFVHKERSYARGFSSITLCLLHEVGHYQTVKQFFRENPRYNRGAEIFKICCKARLYENPEYEANRLYQQLPDELSATTWALDWLADAEHRKLAKAFEKKFFANYEKRA